MDESTGQGEIPGGSRVADFSRVPPFGLPEDETLDEFWKELKGQTDRGVAVLAVGYVEWRVREAIKVKCNVWDAHARRLFGDESKGGRLGFWEQSELAYSLGLLGAVELKDIEWLGQIRNKFAHNPTVRSFDHPEIVRMTNKIETLKNRAKRLEDAFKDVPGVGKVNIPTQPRDIFIHAAHDIANALWLAARHYALSSDQIALPDSYAW